MFGTGKDNTAYAPFLASYWLQQALNTGVNAIEQQTQWLEAGSSQTGLYLIEPSQVVWGQATTPQPMGTLQQVEGVLTNWCRLSTYKASTLAIQPYLKEKIQGAVEKIVVSLVNELDILDHITDFQKWAIVGNAYECLKEAQTEAEVIGAARFAGFEATANRLLELRSYEEDLEPDEQPLNIVSMKHFISFLFNHYDLKEPGITITNEGYIKAIWQESTNQIFWIEFAPNGDVRYLAFIPNRKRSDGIERHAGTSTIEDVYDRAKELHAMDWMEYATTPKHPR